MHELWERLREALIAANPGMSGVELDKLADEALEEELETQAVRAGSPKSFRFDERC